MYFDFTSGFLTTKGVLMLKEKLQALNINQHLWIPEDVQILIHHQILLYLLFDLLLWPPEMYLIFIVYMCLILHQQPLQYTFL